MISDYKKLAELLFPDVTESVEDLEARYPERNLKEGARVTRFAPSPTGYLHVGAFYTALVNLLTAEVSGGTAYLRIEDTDKKREIADGVSAIIDGFKSLGVVFSEGVTGFGTESGEYGPYTQSKRVDVYRVVAKALTQNGLAYPCFCTAEELSALREEEEKDGALITGYFGKYAKCRELSLEEIENKLNNNEPYVLRFRSPGDEAHRITFEDMIRGKIEMPENVIDEVLLKSDGIPTYHFAHICDDHFMRTTHVIRAEEWLSSVPKHIQLFKACGFKAPKYAHVSQVMKLDEEDGNKRKLSKRKDPEAAVSYLFEAGFPKESIIDYLLTLINSTFEDWRRQNPRASYKEFPFNLKKMSPSGCLFDLVKLADVSKNVISLMDADTVYECVANWAKDNNSEFYEIFTKEPARSRDIVNIDRENPKPRKDISKWSEVPEYFAYMYDELYTPCFTLPENISADDAKAVLLTYRDIYSEADEKDEWFEKLKSICEPLGFTPNVKEYKKDPTAFKGHVGDISTVVRLAVTSRKNTPDLCSIMKLLGKERVIKRIDEVIKSL